MTVTKMTLKEAMSSKGLTDWDRLKAEEEAGIEPVPDPDEGEFDWSKAQVRMPTVDDYDGERLRQVSAETVREDIQRSREAWKRGMQGEFKK